MNEKIIYPSLPESLVILYEITETCEKCGCKRTFKLLGNKNQLGPRVKENGYNVSNCRHKWPNRSMVVR